jgi:putative transposase
LAKTLENLVLLLENYYLPRQLEQSIGEFVEYYDNCRYHESLDNLTPADVYFGRGPGHTQTEGNHQTKDHRTKTRLHQQAIAA